MQRDIETRRQTVKSRPADGRTDGRAERHTYRHSGTIYADEETDRQTYKPENKTAKTIYYKKTQDTARPRNTGQHKQYKQI